MATEILIPHKEIANSQTITEVMEAKFKEKDCDIHTHEVTHLEDDFKKGVRKIEVKNTKYFFIKDIPWRI